MSAREAHERLAAVREQIDTAARRSGRDADTITLVGVSKRQPIERIVAAVEAGLDCIGENYVQEAAAKLPELAERLRASGLTLPACRFIGQLQRNKAGVAVTHFDAIETLDRESLGVALERRAADADRTLDVLLQVDLCDEAQKGGAAPDALPALLEASRAWPHLRVRGLMTIPAASDDPERTRPVFARLRELRDTLSQRPGGEALTELSMGMSSDFPVAVEEGATLVRVGTALFGARDT